MCQSRNKIHFGLKKNPRLSSHYSPIQMNGLYLSALHPALSHPPLPRFPCTRCLGERSRAIVIQYCQTWRRSYNPSGFLVSRLPGVMVLLGMDVSSSLSKYPFQRQTLFKSFCSFLFRTKSPLDLNAYLALSLCLSFSTAKKPRVQPGCIQ